MASTKTYSQAIANMYPGDGISVNFPEGFELEYTRWTPEGDKIIKFNCSELKVWYWDEDDHRCKDYYYHEAGNDSWTCKEYSLTKESKEKVWAYLRTLEYPYND